MPRKPKVVNDRNIEPVDSTSYLVYTRAWRFIMTRTGVSSETVVLRRRCKPGLMRVRFQRPVFWISVGVSHDMNARMG